MTEEILSIKSRAEEELKKAGDLKAINNIRIKYLGKKGILTDKIKALGTIEKDNRREYGRVLNETKIKKRAIKKATSPIRVTKKAFCAQRPL